MPEQELNNLQNYIGKRNQNQTDEEVINHINEINNKTPLTQEQWHKLLFSSCNNGYVEILKFVLSHIENLKDIKKYMIHTVYGNYDKSGELTKARIEVLKIFMTYLTINKEECLNETMINAAWFGETEIVKFLIENGADKEYKNENGTDLLKCAERLENEFNDLSLKEYLNKM